MDIDDGVRLGVEEHLVAPDTGGDGEAHQGVVDLVGIDLVGLFLVTDDDVLVQVLRAVLVRYGRGDVLPGDVDALGAHLAVEVPVEPVHARVGDLLGLHGVEDEVLGPFHEGRQEGDFPAGTAVDGSEGEGDDLLAERYVVALVGPALFQGEEPHSRRILALGLSGRHEEEVVLVRFLEGLIFGHGAELEGGGGPQVHHRLAQGSVQHVVSAHHDLRDLVLKVGEEVFPRGHLALGEQGSGHAEKEE